jgi:hypothetical protein
VGVPTKAPHKGAHPICKFASGKGRGGVYFNSDGLGSCDLLCSYTRVLSTATLALHQWQQEVVSRCKKE